MAKNMGSKPKNMVCVVLMPIYYAVNGPSGAAVRAVVMISDGK